jgi:hypothetical protein
MPHFHTFFFSSPVLAYANALALKLKQGWLPALLAHPLLILLALNKVGFFKSHAVPPSGADGWCRWLGAVPPSSADGWVLCHQAVRTVPLAQASRVI